MIERSVENCEVNIWNDNCSEVKNSDVNSSDILQRFDRDDSIGCIQGQSSDTLEFVEDSSSHYLQNQSPNDILQGADDDDSIGYLQGLINMFTRAESGPEASPNVVCSAL